MNDCFTLKGESCRRHSIQASIRFKENDISKDKGAAKTTQGTHSGADPCVHGMKNILVLIAYTLFSTAWSMQISSDSSVVHLSELKKTSLHETKYRNRLTIYIDRDAMPYQEFSVLLSRLYRNGIFNIKAYYKGNALDLSSNGMEWVLPAQLQESTSQKKILYPSSQEIIAEGERYLVLFWQIKGSDASETSGEIERFKQYILSLKSRVVGFVFIVDPEVPISLMFDHISSIPDPIVTKGILLSG